MKRDIGSTFIWLLTRAGQALIVVFGIFQFVARSPVDPAAFFFVILVGGVVMLALDGIAVGAADSRGITFRRYLQEQDVRWRDVEEVAWSPKGIRIKLRDRTWLRRYVQFPLYSGVGRGFQFAFGNAPEPEFVMWLRNHGYVAEDQIRRQNRLLW